MKRSTNLFYTTGSDSNFITFSNYTESLTGNFLSVNTKLFPSHFLCLYLPTLDNSNKSTTGSNESTAKSSELPTGSNELSKREKFIKHIAAYYENKLAFLRDKCIEHNYSVEDNLYPLYYLLEAIKKYDSNFKIEHVGNITEQNYNGTYSDIICVITSSEHSPATINPVINENNEETEYKENYDSSKTYLYGWYNTTVNSEGESEEVYVGPEPYKEIVPKFDITKDGKCYYDYKTNITSLSIGNAESTDIKFNIIIPLYDIINIDTKYYSSLINESNELEGSYTKNVPLGIWFSGKNPITISRNDTEYDPSWSLLLSSQFKPFPYSKKSPTDIDDSAKADAFITFSQILTKQNKLLDKFESLSNQIKVLNDRLNNVISNTTSICSTNNIDKLQLDINNLQKQIKEMK